MTRVGKALVILLSALSVLFLGFAMSVVSTWADWPAKYKAEVAKYDEQNQKRSKHKDKIDELGTAITKEVNQHKQDRDKFAEALKVQEKAHNEQFTTLVKQAIPDVLAYTKRSKEALDEGSNLRKQAEELQENFNAKK